MWISRRRAGASIIGLGVACACFAAALTGAAQQTVPFENGTPIAPAGFEPQPIPAEAVEFDTAEVMRIRVVPVARGLVNPWSLAFLPDGTLLVTEKEGRLRIVRDGVLDPKPVPGVPAVRVQGRSGLLDVLLHPQFAGQPLHLLHVPEAGRRRAAGGADRGSRPLRRRRDHRSRGHLQLRRGRQRAIADRVGARRQTLHDDAEQRERQQFAGSEQLFGQSAAPERRRHGPGGQSVRRPCRTQAGDLYARPPQRARARRPSGDRARCGRAKWVRTAATKSTF